MIRNHFGDVKITGLPRSLFNNAHGLANIKNFSLASNNSIVLAVEKRYYALASASALMSYCELNLNRYFAKQSMWIEYEESDGYAMIGTNFCKQPKSVDGKLILVIRCKYSASVGVGGQRQRGAESQVFQPVRHSQLLQDCVGATCPSRLHTSAPFRCFRDQRTSGLRGRVDRQIAAYT